jgi:hypothetical protein
MRSPNVTRHGRIAPTPHATGGCPSLHPPRADGPSPKVPPRARSQEVSRMGGGGQQEETYNLRSPSTPPTHSNYRNKNQRVKVMQFFVYDRRLGGVSSPLGRPPRNRETVSCRACVRAVAMLGGNTSQTSCVCFSLFPFAPTAFPPSLVGYVNQWVLVGSSESR